MTQEMRLGVNIDHVATVRQARGGNYPDPVKAALLAIEAGADGITLHLREDRRHIQEFDLQLLKNQCSVPINLEMSASDEMIKIAEKYRPEHCCLVPERRAELTTEGGLNVVRDQENLRLSCQRLADAGIQVSLFVNPELEQIDSAVCCGVPAIEIHTGPYANAFNLAQQKIELQRIHCAVKYAAQRGLIVNAGHGLHYGNVSAIASIIEINELNIGHSIIAEAIFTGLPAVVRMMKSLMRQASVERISAARSSLRS